jgi:hypothetical protein
MHTYDLAETAALIDAAVVLGGLRRAKSSPCVWRHLDWDTGQLAVSDSLEQTSAGLRYKETRAVGRGLWRSQEQFSTSSGRIALNKPRNYCDLGSVFRPKR